MYQLQNAYRFGEENDFPQWGNFTYSLTPGSANNFTLGSGASVSLHYNFIRQRGLADVVVPNYRPSDLREPIFVFAHDFGSDSTGNDFAGQLVNQTNLAIKGIVGLQAMPRISRVVGRAADAQYYSSTAASCFTQWGYFAIDPSKRHTVLSYEWRSSWESLYNTYPDKLLNLGNIPQSLYDMQSQWYSTVSQIFGIPLDNRHSYTKSDWECGQRPPARPKPAASSSTDSHTGSNIPAQIVLSPTLAGGHFSLLALLKTGENGQTGTSSRGSLSQGNSTDTLSAMGTSSTTVTSPSKSRSASMSGYNYSSATLIAGTATRLHPNSITPNSTVMAWPDKEREPEPQREAPETVRQDPPHLNCRVCGRRCGAGCGCNCCGDEDTGDADGGIPVKGSDEGGDDNSSGSTPGAGDLNTSGDQSFERLPATVSGEEILESDWVNIGLIWRPDDEFGDYLYEHNRLLPCCYPVSEHPTGPGPSRSQLLQGLENMKRTLSSCSLAVEGLSSGCRSLASSVFGVEQGDELSASFILRCVGPTEIERPREEYYFFGEPLRLTAELRHCRSVAFGYVVDGFFDVSWSPRAIDVEDKREEEGEAE
ncbi:hypothetical protein B0A49_04673 [Cryomyces minteri]|uniref:Glutaminase A central domain-containing protein n=1 Tax=Cryomyces minteri TaxID=331657 RepID=A0A4U0X7A2_9PEZI|nr:hypothetical protein B0A49_04673 [Cryomyces minteri]